MPSRPPRRRPKPHPPDSFIARMGWKGLSRNVRLKDSDAKEPDKPSDNLAGGWYRPTDDPDDDD